MLHLGLTILVWCGVITVLAPSAVIGWISIKILMKKVPVKGGK